MYKYIFGFLLVGLSLCSAKRSHHHHKHHAAKKNVTLVDLGKEKSIISKKPQGTTITKKQSLGMPLNNNDETGLGGEPVGHLDASEGVGGLGGDQDGIPIGMGAGAEPLGMAKGKEMAENGGAMQGLNEESENLHENEDVSRPFQEQQDGGDFIEGEHGESMMNGHGSNFMPSSSNGGAINMMGSPNGGMHNFAGNSEDEGEHEEGFRGPKKDPLGAEIRPFNDEFKNDNGGEQESHMMGNHHGDSSHGMSFVSPMHDESEEHDLSNPSNGDEIVNGNMASIQGDDMSKSGGNFMGQPSDDSGFRGPKKDPLGADIKPFNDEHKNDGMGDDEEPAGDHSMNFMGKKGKGSAKAKDASEVKGSQGSESDFSNPSPADIGKALNGNLAALDSVNIQGDSDVAEMVRKATHAKEFASHDSGTFNGISLMDPGYSSTTKQFFGNENTAKRRTKKGSHSVRAHAKTKVARGKDTKKRNKK